MQLKSLVPQCQKQDNVHKLDVLQGAIDYILELQSKLAELMKSPHHTIKHHHPPQQHHRQLHDVAPLQYKFIRQESHVHEHSLPGISSPNGRKTPPSSSSPPPPAAAAVLCPQPPPLPSLESTPFIYGFNYPEPNQRRMSPVKRGRPARPSPMSPGPSSISRHASSSPLSRTRIDHPHSENRHQSQHQHIIQAPFSPIDSTISIKSESTESSLPSPPSTHDSPPPNTVVSHSNDSGDDPLRLLSDAAAKLSDSIVDVATSTQRIDSGIQQREGQKDDVLSIRNLLS